MYQIYKKNGRCEDGPGEIPIQRWASRCGIMSDMPFAALFSDPLTYLLYFASLVICITIHEFSHAWVADRLGDPSPRLAGRITLNPLAHLDPLGTIAMVLFRFGWGKPVLFDAYNLKNPKRDIALIALAGPASNLVLAGCFSLILRLMPIWEGIVPQFLYFSVLLNVGLAIFNLLPVHPLDGGKILIGIAPKEVAREWDQMLNQYGVFILLALFLPIANGVAPLHALLFPIVDFILKLLLGA